MEPPRPCGAPAAPAHPRRLLLYVALLAAATFTQIHSGATQKWPATEEPTEATRGQGAAASGARAPGGGVQSRSGAARAPPYMPPPGVQRQPAGANPAHHAGAGALMHGRVVDWTRPGGMSISHLSEVVVEEEYGGGGAEGCAEVCEGSQFACQVSCTCIPLEKRCDDVADCAEAEDEAQCARACDEHHNRTFCPRTGACISKEWLCDGDNDCGDFSDETHCGGAANCTSEQFECANGLCIHASWVCDQENDCKDESDELNCTKNRCTDAEFPCSNGQCVALHWKCDKEPDCMDSSDEAECPVDIQRCGEGEFQCTNKRCVRKDFHCDGDNDCADWSDEDSCPALPGSCNAGEFKCNSDGKCIPDRWHCDRERDCADGSDEADCERVGLKNCTRDEHTCGDNRCILKTWVCDGVADCSDGEDELRCNVSCEADQYMCRQHLNRTISSAFRTCVNRKHVCDGQKDCPRGDDEENCPTRRACTAADRCERLCVTTHAGNPACSCPPGYLLSDDGYGCDDIDECMYAQDPVCSQTCSNTLGSFVCGCVTGYVLRPDLRTCKAMGASPTLLFSNRLEIRQVSLSSDKYLSILKGLHNAVALDYHYEKQLIFWSENSLDVIRVAHIDNPNTSSDVIRWGLDSPGGVAVDWVHDLLFWTDSGTRRVEVATLDGKQRSVIAANDLDKPRAIAVHPGDALVFWTDWGPNPKIERADMDGSNRKSVIVDHIFWPNGLTIDFTGKTRIFWADAKHHVIESAALDGRDRKKVTNKGLPHPFALTIFEDAVYWTDWHTKSISTVNKITGMGLQTIHSGLSVPMDIHSYHPQRQPPFTSHCGRNNGGCSHLCLPNGRDRSCRCPVGFVLHSDGRTCEDTPEKLLLFARRKDIRLKPLNPRKHADAIDMVIPVDNIKSAVALAWDHSTNSIFWTDVEKDTINRACLNGSHQTVIVSSNLISPAGLAFDWVTSKIYWTDAGTNRIEVANSDGSMRTLLAWEDIDKPRDIVVDPIGGLMYWSDWGSLPCIESAAMDGTGRKRIVSGNMTWPNGLALDLDSHRLYWTDGGTRTIEYANLDGSGRSVLIGRSLPHPFGLDLFGDEIFWTDWESLSIQAANKLTGKSRRTLGAGVSGLMDVRVFHKERRGGDNRCGKHNGGCSHLCLLKPRGYSCACPIGIKLSKDNKTCSSGPTNFLIFAHRVDIRVVSLDVPYLIDVVVPLPPLKNALGVDVDRKTGHIFWTDTAERTIHRSDSDGKNIATIIGTGLHTADGIVIDSTGRKIYWTDGGRNSIEVAELDGRNRKVLIWNGLDSPRAIALHYHHGYMFWSDWGAKAKIERADMDGRNRRVIVDNNIKWPNGLAIDRPEGRLYWNDAKRLTIESSDLNGNDRRTVRSEVPYPYGIVIVGKHVYWTDWKTKALHRADKNNGSGVVVVRDKLEGLMDIRSVQADNTAENACGANNGGCSHLCLRSPGPGAGYSCACPTGVMFLNATHCRAHPENFLLFATRSSVATISLDTDERWEVTLPLAEVQNSIAVDFHWERGLLFYTDVNLDVIRRVNMNNSSESATVVSENLHIPNGLAVDWIADNIYWTDNEQKVVEVARLDGSSRKVIISGLDEPRALALFPAKGYLYWTDWGETPKIERSRLDGSERTAIVSSDLGFPNGLALDCRERRLYWTDALKDRIDTSDLHGQHRVQLVPDAKNPFGMTQFRDYIYWTDWYKKSVMRADKRRGGNVVALRTDLEMVMEIKAVSQEKQRGWNPCREDNGECTHLCLFRGKDYVCACPDTEDSKPCDLVPAAWVSLAMPAHYPAADDFSDAEDGSPPAAAPPPAHRHTAYLVYTALLVLFLLLAAGIAFLFNRSMNCCGMFATRSFRTSGGIKEVYRDSHISFPNPNYAGSAGSTGSASVEGEPRRQNRFQGIFKYERSQERVTNVYLPEGASLLVPPPPPPPASAPPPRSSSHDDFHTVTLHPIG